MHRRGFLLGALAIPPAVAGCLDTFEGSRGDGGRYELDSFSTSSERVAPEHRFTVRARAFYRSVDADHDVIEYDDLSEAVRSVVDAVLTDGVYSSPDLPGETQSILHSHDFVDCTGAGTGHDFVGFEVFEVDPAKPPRLAVDARVVDPVAERDDPATIELTATNDGDRPLAWSTGAPGPFGIRRSEAGVVLWTDSYEESRHVHVEGGEIRGGNDVAVGTKLRPGETVTEHYEIQVERDGFGPDSDALSGELSTEFEGGRETVSYSLTWTVREA